MDYLILVLALIIFGLGLYVFKLRNEKLEGEKETALVEKEKDEYAEMGKGLAEYNQKMQEKKNQAKEKILETLKTKTKISNHDVAEILDISSASVRRYFDDLETEGKVKQVGKVGQKVFYTAI